METPTTHKCLSCGQEYEGNYCPNCGQSHRVGRFTTKRLLTETIPDILNMDNQFGRTCVALFRCPGQMIMEYIRGKRVKYHKPIPLLFVLASVLIVISHICQVDTVHVFHPEIYRLNLSGREVVWCTEGSFLDTLIRLLHSIYWNEAWSTLVSITLFAWPLKHVFRKTEVGRSLNLAECFFIMLFLNCQSLIVKILQIPLNYLCSFSDFTSGIFDDGNIDLLCAVLWLWSFMQIFGTSRRRTLWNYLKAYILMYALITLFILVGSILVAVFGINWDGEQGVSTYFQQVTPTHADSLMKDLDSLITINN